MHHAPVTFASQPRLRIGGLPHYVDDLPEQPGYTKRVRPGRWTRSDLPQEGGGHNMKRSRTKGLLAASACARAIYPHPRGTMIKSLSIAAVLSAAAAALLFLPATPAHASSPSCAKAIELINIAIDTSGGTLDSATATALSERLTGLADFTQGAEKDAITAYAQALIDDNVTDLAPYTDELNRACA